MPVLFCLNLRIAYPPEPHVRNQQLQLDEKLHDQLDVKLSLQN